MGTEPSVPDEFWSERITSFPHAGASSSSSGKAFQSSIRLQPEARGDTPDWRRQDWDDRWYDVNIPIADRLYDAHLKELKEEAKKEAAGNGQEV